MNIMQRLITRSDNQIRSDAGIGFLGSLAAERRNFIENNVLALKSINENILHGMEYNGGPSGVLEMCLNLSTAVGVDGGLCSDPDPFVADTISATLAELIASADIAILSADRIGETEAADNVSRSQYMIHLAKDETSTDGPDEHTLPVVDWAKLSVALAMAVDVSAFAESGVDNRQVMSLSLGLLARLNNEPEFWQDGSCPVSFETRGGVVGAAREDERLADLIVEVV